MKFLIIGAESSNLLYSYYLADKSINLVYDDNWYKIGYKKLVANTVFNPLTALFNVQNVKLFRNKYLKKINENTCKEAAENINSNFVKQWKNLKRVCFLIRKNILSIKADLLASQLTEIDAIGNYLLNQTKFYYSYFDFVFKSIKVPNERRDQTE